MHNARRFWLHAPIALENNLLNSEIYIVDFNNTVWQAWSGHNLIVCLSQEETVTGLLYGMAILKRN